MKTIILAAAVLGASALAIHAQTAKPPTSGNTPAVATPDSTNPTAPVEGANSFTESQAKARIEKAGYADVTGLKLTDKGIWHATAMKDGKSVSVGLDYQGNIVAQ